MSTNALLRPVQLTRHARKCSHLAKRSISCRSQLSYSDLKKVAEDAARAGAAVVMEAVDKPRNIQFKGATDLVTDTDKAAEEACLAVVRAAYPDHAILGEEGGVSGDPSSGYLWCIDPLDGTTNFAHSYPAFAVSIGVLRHSTPVAAAVVEFFGGPKAWGTRVYTAGRNGGAFCNGEPISVSRTSDLTRSLLVTGFGYEHDEAWAANMQLFKEFTDVTQGVRRSGSAAIDLCHVAMGVVDGYWEYRLKPWDVCAGVLIVEEAGGKVTTMTGNAYSVFDRSILATNDALHSQIREKTEPATKQLIDDRFDLSQWYIPPGYGLRSGPQLG